MTQTQQLLREVLKKYISHNKIEVSEETLKARFKAQGTEYINKVFEIVEKDTTEACFGLKPKRPTNRQMEVGRISLTHGLTKLAEFLATGKNTLSEIK